MANESTDRLRALLNEAGMSQRQFAREISYESRLIRHYCSDKCTGVPKVVMICAEWFAALKRGGG